jgi:hypothetical protein
MMAFLREIYPAQRPDPAQIASTKFAHITVRIVLALCWLMANDMHAIFEIFDGYLVIKLK